MDSFELVSSQNIHTRDQKENDEDEIVFTGYNPDENSQDEIEAKKEIKVKCKKEDEEYEPPMPEDEVAEEDEAVDEGEITEEDALDELAEDEDVGDDGYSLYGLRRSNRFNKKNYTQQDEEEEEMFECDKRKRKKNDSDEDFMGTFGAEDEEEEEECEGSDFEDEMYGKRNNRRRNYALDSFENNNSFNDDDSADDFGYNNKLKRGRKPKNRNIDSDDEDDDFREIRATRRRKGGGLESQEDDSEGSDWGKRNRVHHHVPPHSKKVNGHKKGNSFRHNDPNLQDEHGWMRPDKGSKYIDFIEESDSDLDKRRRTVSKKISYKEEESDAEEFLMEDLENEQDELLHSEEPIVPLKTIDKIIVHRPLGGDENDIKGGVHKKSRSHQIMQYLIKWTNTAHIHNTWETEKSLRDEEVGGLKKLENYMKIERELEKWKFHASPEDLDYYYCQKEMSDDLLQQYRILERIISSKIVEQTSIIKRKVKSLVSKKHLFNSDKHPIYNTLLNNDAADNTLNNKFIDQEMNLVSTTNEVENESLDRSEYVEEEVEIDEEIITKQIMYLCKWNGLPYMESTWETENFIFERFSNAIPSYEKRESSERIPYKTCKALRIRPRFVLMKEQPEYMGNAHLILRDYQLDGVNWLARSWCKNNSVILADEMGLGKTIQVLSFCNYLFHQHQLYGPFLIVAPLSTIAAWQKEAFLWTPDFNTVTYLGDAKSREIIQEYEWRHGATKRLKFNILLTTYEILLKDREFLSSINWALLAVDEAHRLKNEDSLFYRELIAFRTNFRLLITGTPLQNTLKELWALLHFIMPYKFDVWEDFEAIHTNADKSGYSKLHKELEPFILRRVKKDVEKSLPSKVEQILRVEMTSLQKQYYKWILTKNFKALSKGNKGSVSSLLNVVMELKKCCNHAMLTKSQDDLLQNNEPLQPLFRGSGKLILLDKLLCRLKETGHRVLIFSQMVRMLDIIAEYLQYRCFLYQRLDGSVRNEIRKQALDHFNADNSQDFCFLLSTRAGGLGVNLATADTVIIFDSDWNPQNDLQAQARAHRIGQKNQVNIYRLVTKNSIEEEIIQRAKKKMILDHLVIQRMNTTGKLVISGGNAPAPSNRTSFSKAELSSILKFGAEDLFKAEAEDEEPQVDIDDILKRAETADEGPTSLAEELLSQFKVTDFAGLEESLEPQVSTKTTKKKSKHCKNNEDPKDYTFEENSSSSIEEDDHDSETSNESSTKDWHNIIPKDVRDRVQAEEKEKEIMALNKLGPRKRKPIYEHLDLDIKKLKKTRDNNKFIDVKDEDYHEGSPDSSDSETDKSKHSKSKVGKSLPFNDTELRKFIKSFRKFPNPQNRLEEIVYDCDLQDKPAGEIKTLCKVLLSNYREALLKLQHNHLMQLNSAQLEQSGTFKINQLSFPLFPFKKSMNDLDNIYNFFPKDKNERKRFKINIPFKNPNWGVPWTNEDDSKLLIGIYEHGIGNWENIKMDTLLGLQNKILPNNNAKPKAKNLQTRLEYLLKTIRSSLPTNNRSSLNNEKKKKKIKRCNEIDEQDNNVLSQPDIKELPEDIFLICKEKMRPVKKSLKQLDFESQCDVPTPALKSCLVIIGDHITKLCEDSELTVNENKVKEWRNYLWVFVSKFTEHDSRYLNKLYKHTLKKRNPSLDKKIENNISTLNNTPSITMYFKKNTKNNDTNYSTLPSYNCVIKTTNSLSTQPITNTTNAKSNNIPEKRSPKSPRQKEIILPDHIESFNNFMPSKHPVEIEEGEIESNINEHSLLHTITTHIEDNSRHHDLPPHEKKQRNNYCKKEGTHATVHVYKKNEGNTPQHNPSNFKRHDGKTHVDIPRVGDKTKPNYADEFFRRRKLRDIYADKCFHRPSDRGKKSRNGYGSTPHHLLQHHKPYTEEGTTGRPSKSSVRTIGEYHHRRDLLEIGSSSPIATSILGEHPQLSSPHASPRPLSLIPIPPQHRPRFVSPPQSPLHLILPSSSTPLIRATPLPYHHQPPLAPLYIGALPPAPFFRAPLNQQPPPFNKWVSKDYLNKKHAIPNTTSNCSKNS